VQVRHASPLCDVIAHRDRPVSIRPTDYIKVELLWQLDCNEIERFYTKIISLAVLQFCTCDVVILSYILEVYLLSTIF